MGALLDISKLKLRRTVSVSALVYSPRPSCHTYPGLNRPFSLAYKVHPNIHTPDGDMSGVSPVSTRAGPKAEYFTTLMSGDSVVPTRKNFTGASLLGW